MLPLHLLQRPITIITPAESVDRYGTTVLNWATATTRVVLGDLQPKGASEDEEGRSLQVATAVLYLRPNSGLTGHERIRVDDVTYQVIGPPQIVARLGVPHHMIANVRAVEG